MEFFKKKSTIIILAIVAVVVILIAVVAGSYNGFVDSQQTVEKYHSDISVQLKRRADLIPNFVKTVKEYSDYEQETYLAVTNARSAVKNATTVEEQSAAAAQLDSAIDVWVNAVTEAYPELKANENYVALQDELAGTENRIAKARRDYNEAVKAYNSKVKRFPSNLLAGMFGFEEASYFEISNTDSQVPEVNFD